MKARYRYPVKVTETSWFYENLRSIEFVVECRKDGIYHWTQTVKIPKRLLERLDLNKRVKSHHKSLEATSVAE